MASKHHRKLERLEQAIAARVQAARVITAVVVDDKGTITRALIDNRWTRPPEDIVLKRLPRCKVYIGLDVERV